METLGKCLLFYLKYHAEMEALYHEEEPNVEGLPNADEVLKKINLVGDRGSQEGAQLLESCASRIEEHLRNIAEFERSRNKLENSWDLRYFVTKKKRQLMFGTSISLLMDKWALVPWVWCRGGRRNEGEVVRILGRGKTAAEIGWGSGLVILPEIEMPIPDQLEQPVPCEPFVAHVRREFESIGTEEVKAIAAIASKR